MTQNSESLSDIPEEFLDIYMFKDHLNNYVSFKKAIKSVNITCKDINMYISAENFKLCYYYILMNEDHKEALRLFLKEAGKNSITINKKVNDQDAKSDISVFPVENEINTKRIIDSFDSETLERHKKRKVENLDKFNISKETPLKIAKKFVGYFETPRMWNNLNLICFLSCNEWGAIIPEEFILFYKNVLMVCGNEDVDMIDYHKRFVNYVQEKNKKY